MRNVLLVALALAFAVMAWAEVLGHAETGDVEVSQEERDEMTADKKFPEVHWEEMRSKMETDGPQAVVTFIESFSRDKERRELYSFAQRAFGMQDWEGKNFDGCIAVVRAGIAEGISQSEAAENPEDAAKLKDFANILSYNMSADLAECWPGDTMVREKRHLEAGLTAAQDCIRWREELKKGPFPFAIAYWAKGMHQLSLGDSGGSVQSFQVAFDYGVKHAEQESIPAEVSAESTFLVILNSGYLGIAQWLFGDESGRERYEAACNAFHGQMERFEQKKDDAQFGLEQLQYVKEKFLN